MLKHSLVPVFIMLGVIVLLAGSVAAQDNAVGTVRFYHSGTGNQVQSNSAISLSGGHSISCAQDPVWTGSEIKGKTATNTSLFGPCAVDGVLVHHIVLYQAHLKSNLPLLMVLEMMDGTSWSLMLVNSGGVSLQDLVNISTGTGLYAGPTSVTFSLIGQHDPTWN